MEGRLSNEKLGYIKPQDEPARAINNRNVRKMDLFGPGGLY
jgi:hypothetical protein